MPARRQFEAQEAGAAADIERTEPKSCAAGSADRQIHDPVPSGALVRRRDAVAEIGVEMRRAPVPMRSDLLLDRIGLHRGRHYLSPATSASASTCSGWRHTGFSIRWLAPFDANSSNCSRTCSGVPWMAQASVPGGL